ncbi:MAG: alpha/beta hydrolase [Anaerolineae bacterium]
MMTTTYTNNVMAEKVPSRRGCLFYVTRLLKWLGIALVTLILLGVIYQTVATEADKRAYSPAGQLYAVNDHQMHLYCTGEGSPTVILDAGAVAMWAWIQPTVAQSTRVCSYDRAGYVWSEPGPEPRDAQHIAADLHSLLEVAGVTPPYIIAGHSLGGLYARVFSHSYPGEVIGMVLLDATHPDTWERQGESVSALQMASSVSTVLARVGLMRLFTASQNFDLPEAENALLKADASSNQYWDSQRADTAALPATLEQGRAAGSLGDVPLVVLAAITRTKDQGQDIERALQQELAALSTNSVYREIEGAGHITLLTDNHYASFVSEAIVQVLTAVRTGNPLG